MNITEKGRPEIVVAADAPAGSEVAADDPRLIRALEEYRALLEAGCKLDRQEFQARHAEISAALGECLDGLEFIHLAAPQLHPARPKTSLRASGDIEPEAPLGDYRIVRELGRGGMGVVYEAVQISLGRRVALKVLPFAAALDAKQLQRFKNEAQAAAHLHHTNIVPVYGVGCQRGVHFYAMQFIDGQTMAAMIAELRQHSGLETPDYRAQADPQPTGSYAPSQVDPDIGAAPTAAVPGEAMATERSAPVVDSPPGWGQMRAAFCRTVANLGLQAAEALEHAHQLGVVHRDIKPANLLVDPRGNLWITDFGLAHCHSQAGLTMTGDLIGTLRYMSPEQALAQRVVIDHRTDVYSLGATLYELLTLEPVFAGHDRQELLRRIAFEEPKAPRRVNKAIPAELETIVLKALEKNPADRYATAGELADDLGRFLRDESIRAKRPSLVQKVKKWGRRHPGIVRTALGSGALLLVTIAVAAMLANARLSEEQQATRAQLELTQKAEAETSQRLYRSLVDQARASRLSRRIGQRFETLAVLDKAARMARDMKLPETDFLKLRNEAIACLALPDLRVAKEWDGSPTGTWTVEFAGTLERYARVDRQGIVSVRRVADDTELYHLSGMGPGESFPWFSPDGRFLALFRLEGRFQVWNLVGQEPVKLLEGAMDTFAFSPDSRQLARAWPDGSLSLYDLPSARETKQQKAGPRARTVAFHPKDRQLAVSHAAGVQIRDLATGNVVAELAHPAGAWHLAWHPNGKTLAAVGSDWIIHIWDVATRKQVARLEGHKNAGIFFAYNRGGDLLVSTCWDGVLRLWDPRTGQQLFQTQTGARSLYFSADDRLLAGGYSGDKLRLWEVARPLARLSYLWIPIFHKMNAEARLQKTAHIP